MKEGRTSLHKTIREINFSIYRANGTLQTQQRDQNVQWKNVRFLNGRPHKYMHEYLIHSSSVYEVPLITISFERDTE